MTAEGIDPGSGRVAPAVTETTQTPDLGTYGIWRGAAGLPPELGTAIEKLGFGTIWIGGSPRADLRIAEKLLDATEHITVATGIVNIWSSPAAEVAESYHRLEAAGEDQMLTIPVATVMCSVASRSFSAIPRSARGEPPIQMVPKPSFSIAVPSSGGKPAAPRQIP